ncbi:hypothetical protein [Rubricoccus marinus]|uniref:Uncharacterized protein n=1 Tax=Rubricoccus marinus TaxID=716817 RepID=A0A259TXQ0_9BACT|nr:hypothetical protein [Rubricoccus marinus]OZC02397.1 hypothetical protein BSZ36_05055 [Rubricoccus marinus]
MTPTQDPSHFCPGCSARFCQCSTADGYDDHLDASYADGYDACVVDGFENRPTRFPPALWRGVDVAAWLGGFDDAGAGLPCAVRSPERYTAVLQALGAGGDTPSR